MDIHGANVNSNDPAAADETHQWAEQTLRAARFLHGLAMAAHTTRHRRSFQETIELLHQLASLAGVTVTRDWPSLHKTSVLHEPHQAADVTARLDVSLEELHRGATRSVTIQRLEPCTHCCAVRDRDQVWCEACDGAGVVVQYSQVDADRVRQQQRLCQACLGVGQRHITHPSESLESSASNESVLLSNASHVSNSDTPHLTKEQHTLQIPCTHCHGTGWAVQTRTIQVHVPRGALQPEHRIRVPEQGHAVPGARNGDLVVTLHHAEHPFFALHDRQLHYHKTVSLSEALFGVHFALVDLDGQTVHVRSQTNRVYSPGVTYRVRQLGIFDEQANARGDLVVQLQIDFPDTNQHLVLAAPTAGKPGPLTVPLHDLL